MTEEIKKLSEGILLFLLIFTIIFTGCKEEIPENQSPTAEPTGKYTDTVTLLDIEPLQFSFINTESKLKSLEKWEYLADYLTAKTGIPLEVKIFDNESEIIDSLSMETTDIAFIDSLAYIRAGEKENIKLILRSIEDGSPFTRSYIIVQKNNNLKSIKDLKNRKFAFADKISASGYLFPRVLLAREGIKDINNFFSEVQFAGDEQSSFLAVYNGYADAGVVSQSIMNNDDERLKEIKVLAETEAIPLGTVIVRKDLDEGYAARLEEALSEIGTAIDSRDLINEIKIDGFVKATDSDYDLIRENLKTLNLIEKK